MLPTRRAAWAAWNYERSANVQEDGQESGHNHVCLHYLINLLQPLPWQQEVVVSLNPVRRIDERKIIQRIAYDHPVFDAAALQAQKKIKQLQGQQRSAFCGAWCGYGFHEDGLKSGLAAAKSLVNALTLVHSEAEMARQAA